MSYETLGCSRTLEKVRKLADCTDEDEDEQDSFDYKYLSEIH